VFITKALSPARVSDMLLEEDFDTGRTATVVVPDDQLSLAIGREGQNARLAAKLTGWRIDIKSVSEAATEAFALLDKAPLNALKIEKPEMIAEVMRVMEKKRLNRPIQPEEFHMLTDFVRMAERRLMQNRESGRSERKEAMEMVRSLVPPRAFEMEIAELELDDDINKALSRIDNVGELMVRMLADEDALGRVLKQGGAGDDAMEAIRYALDDLVILGEEEAAAAAAEAQALADAETAAAAEAGIEAPVIEEVDEPVAAVEASAELEAPVELLVPDLVEDEDAVVLPAFIEPEPEEVPAPRKAKPTFDRPAPHFEDEEAILEREKKAKAAKAKGKKRTDLVFDEDRGEVIAKKRRKGGRVRSEWEEDEF
jgi:N utilization substance protein A